MRKRDDQEGAVEYGRLTNEFKADGELSDNCDKRLVEIAEERQKLSDYVIRKIKQIIVGISLLSATAQVAEAGMTKNDTEKISGKVNVAMLENTERDQDLRERIKETAEYVRNVEINHISDNEYLKKLTVEFKGDEKLAKKEQQKRLENLKSVNVIIHNDLKEVTEELEGGQAGDKPAAGFYREKEHEIHVARQYVGLWSTLQHEFKHASLKGYQNITPHAKEILEDTYQKQGFLGIFKNINDEYLGDHAERIVRKQEVDGELEGRGIKKYGEGFTEENYERMMMLYRKGKLSEAENDFIKRTKPGFENFKKIFEEIAKNENNKDVLNA
jgi:hypothetical protein